MIALFVEGTMNVLKHHGILAGPMGRTAKDVRVYVGNSAFPILATAGGLVEFLVKLNDRVEVGQKVAVQRNSFGEVVAEYASGVAGEITGLRSDALSEPGNPLAFILFNRPGPAETPPTLNSRRARRSPPMYVLHYAPDNASLAVRLALEELGLPYRTALVDRARQAQEGAAYRAVTPTGLIPALETPDGVIFETGAILLWLADRHGGLAPAPDAPERGDFLKWFFLTANTLHPDLRALFYPHRYAGADKAGHRALTEDRILALPRDARRGPRRRAGLVPPRRAGRAWLLPRAARSAGSRSIRARTR